MHSETGIEYYENSVLKGSDVTLTINSKAQDAAWNALQTTAGGKPGAVVALNPQTGAILTMASYPSYDPNVLATHNGTKLNAADRALLAGRRNPLLNRVMQLHLAARLHIQHRDELGATSRRTRTAPRQTNVYSPTQLTLPQTTHVLTNDQRRGLRERQRPGAADHRLRPVVRHHVRQPRHRAGSTERSTTSPSRSG